MPGYTLLARNTFANVIGRVAAIGFALVVSTTLFKRIGPTDYGIWSLLIAIAGYSMLFDFGLGAAVERRVAVFSSQEDHAGIGVTLSSALTLLFVSLGILQLLVLGWFLASNAFAWPVGQMDRGLIVLPICMGMTASGLIVGAGLSGLQRMALLHRWRVVGLACGSVAVLAFAINGFRRMDVLLLVYCVGGVVASFFQWNTLRVLVPALRLQPRWDRQAIRDLLAFGGVLQIATMVPPVAEYGLRVLISARFGIEMAGIYDLAARAAIVLRSVAGALFTAMVPFSVHTLAEGGAERAEHLVRVTVRYTALLVLPASAVVWSQSDNLVALWLGHTAAAAQVAQGVRILVVAHAVGCLSGPIAMVGRAAGRPIFEAAVTAISFLTALGIGLWVTSWPVMFGLGWSAAAIGGLVLWMLLSRALSIRFKSGADLAMVALLTALVLAVAEGGPRLAASLGR